MEPRTPESGSRRPSGWGGGQDILRALAGLERQFPGAVIWFGRATGHWWAMAVTGHGTRLAEAESPAALAAALARLGAGGPARPGPGGAAPTRPQAVARPGPAPPGIPPAPGHPRDGTDGSPSP